MNYSRRTVFFFYVSASVRHVLITANAELQKQYSKMNFLNGAIILVLFQLALGARPINLERTSPVAFNEEHKKLMNTNNDEYTLPPYYPTRKLSVDFSVSIH